MKKILGLGLAIILFGFAGAHIAQAALTLSANAVTGDGVLTLQGTSLAVTGNTTFSGNIAAGGSPIDPNAYFNVAATNNVNGATFGSRYSLTRTDASIGFTMTGIRSDVTFNSATSGSTASIYGMIGTSVLTGGGGGGDAYGASFGVTSVNNGSNFVNKASGVQVSMVNVNSGTITSTRGIDLSGWLKIGGAVNTNSYGIYMDTSIDVGTTRYAIYSLSTSQSYLQGNLGLGTATPGAKLDVKDGHYASSQTTLPTSGVTGAGYSGASMVAGSTDTKGAITATVGAAAGTLVVTFNAGYTSAPICTITPNTATAQVDGGKMYSTTSTSALTLNFVATPTGGSETWSYICVQ